MKLRSRVTACILAAAMIVSSLQYPAMTARAEELPQELPGITNVADDTVTGAEEVNVSGEVHGQEENETQAAEKEDMANGEEKDADSKENDGYEENSVGENKTGEKAEASDEKNADSSDAAKILAVSVEESGTCGENLTWEFVDGTLTISGDGPMEDYHYFNYDIPWYDFSESITSVKISYGVTSIGEEAFFKCSSLASVEIPSSVASINYAAFYGCTSLASVEIPSSVTSIGWSAFKECSSLASVEIPSSITSIGEGGILLLY